MSASELPSTTLAAELQELRSIFNSTVKVVKNAGEFSHLVTVRCKSPAFTLKFQLTETYPVSSPHPIFLTSTISRSRAKEVETALLASNQGRQNSHMIGAYYTAKHKLKCLLAPKDEASGEKKVSKRSKSGHRKKTVEHPAELDANGDLIREKKAPMKTAIDVINRILWDDGIDKASITIGYVDRFLGILEKPFFAFSWEDIASIDYYTFAVPKHRIEYFKYRRARVWDKQTRLDNVFGSLGTGMTIAEVIAGYRDEDYPLEEGEEIPTSERFAGLYDNDEEGTSSDEDGGFEIVMQQAPPPGVVRSSSVALSEEEGEREAEAMEDGETASAEKTYWEDKCRPNFFICVRITDPDVRAAASKIQDMVCDQEPRYEECCTPEAMLHVTLCTLRLDSAEQVANCLQALEDSRVELSSLLPRKPLHLRGLGRFHGRVLYARVHETPELLTFVDHLETCLRAAGLRGMDSHEFVAHMSLVKVTRPVSRIIGTKNISPLLYHGSEEVDFGDQPVGSIYLCSMEKTRGPDGFYLSPGCVTFMREIL